MSSLRTTLSFVIAVGCAGSITGQGFSYRPIPNGINGADVTPDGKIVVGGGPQGAFYWRWQTDPTPTLIGAGNAVAVSDDGSVIAGNITSSVTGQEVAAIWTQADGWTELGGLPSGGCDAFLSAAYDISADGKAVVGLGWEGCSGRAFLWTEEDGMQLLEFMGLGSNRANVISGDGKTVGGFVQGTGSRTPAVWNADTLTGTVFDLDAVGEARGVDGYGSVTMGDVNENAYYNSDDAGFVNLGTLNDDWVGATTGVSENRERFVGFDYIGLSREAWTYTESGGMRSLYETLDQAGVQGLPAKLEVCRKVSADGTVIVGNNVVSAWIVTLPPIVGWNQYGIGGAAANTLDLDGGGDDFVGGTFQATTTNAVGSATATFISLDSGNLPFLGGAFLLDALKLVNPVLIEATTGGSSTNVIPIPNDPALAGISVFFQSMAEDGGQPFGFAFSNGLELTLGA